MFRREPKAPAQLLQFDMKVVFEYGQGVSELTYQTNAESADAAISAIFTDIGGEKVICVSSSQQGKSVVVPRSKLISVEALFNKVLEEKE